MNVETYLHALVTDGPDTCPYQLQGQHIALRPSSLETDHTDCEKSPPSLWRETDNSSVEYEYAR